MTVRRRGRSPTLVAMEPDLLSPTRVATPGDAPGPARRDTRWKFDRGDLDDVVIT